MLQIERSTECSELTDVPIVERERISKCAIHTWR
jgi:hypothetical protein